MAFIEAYAHLNQPEEFNRYLQVSFTIEQFQKEWAQADSLFFMALHEDELVGYFKINLDAPQPALPTDAAYEIERIYVHPNLKGRGIGSQLLQEAIQVGKLHGKAFVWLGVWEHNKAGIEFYQRKGFQRFGAYIFHMGNDKQTDWLMQLKIVDL